MSRAATETLVEVATPQGPGRFHVREAVEPVALLVLGHGAGGGVDAPDLTALARRLPEQGVTVLRFEQPWRVAGKRVWATFSRQNGCHIARWDAVAPWLLPPAGNVR